MHRYGRRRLYADENMPWLSKADVISTIREKWDFHLTHYIVVNKILWDSSSPWTRHDDVYHETTAFDMYRRRDLGELTACLFQASIDGYAIRHVSTDMLSGIYLERTQDHSTNIDEDVLSTLVEVVELNTPDDKFRSEIPPSAV